MADVSPAQSFITKQDKLAVMLGLILNSPQYQDKTVSWINTHFSNALAAKQVKILSQNGMPSAMVTWAYLNEDVETRLLAKEGDIRAHEWNSGERLWIIDRVGTSKTSEIIFEQFEEALFDSKPVQIIQDCAKLNFSNILEKYNSSKSSKDVSNQQGLYVRFPKTEHEVDAILDMAEQLYKESPAILVDFDRDQQRKYWKNFFQGHETQLAPLIAFSGKKPVGFLIGVIGTHMGSKILAAQNQGFYVIPEYRGSKAPVLLMKAFRKWAKFCDARILTLTTATGIRLKETDKFFRKLGFSCIGGTYQLTLKVDNAVPQKTSLGA